MHASPHSGLIFCSTMSACILPTRVSIDQRGALRKGTRAGRLVVDDSERLGGLFYDEREATSRLILAPIDLSATSRSCSDCSPTQNAAEVPKYFARRSAVSADKLLLHFVISVSRDGGMPVARDTDARLSPIGLMNSSSKISPG